MTRTYKFGVQPGVQGPLSAQALSLTNVRPILAPAGPVTALLDRLTGTYTAIQIARISQSYRDLADAGILDKLDRLCIRMATTSDSFMNWIGPVRPVQNYGAVFRAGTGFEMNGVDQSIDVQFAPSRYAAGDATLFTWLPLGSLGGRVFGRAAETGTSMTSMFVSSDTTGARLNYGVGVSVPHGEGGREDHLWSVTNVGNTCNVWRDGELLGNQTFGAAPVMPATGIAIGRDGPTFGHATTSAFGYGAALTSSQLDVLSGAIRAMHQVF